MVGRDAKVDLFSRVKLVVLSIPLCHGVCFANSDNCGLGPENSRHEVSSSNIANTWNAKCWICEVTSGQTSVCRFLGQSFNFRVDLKNTFILDLLDVRHCKSVFAINRNSKVMVLLYNVSLDKAIRVKLIVNQRVNNREFGHRDGACFNEERKHSKLWMNSFHFVSQFDEMCRVNAVREHKEGDWQGLCHCFSHCFLHSCDLFDPKKMVTSLLTSLRGLCLWEVRLCSPLLMSGALFIPHYQSHC